MSDLELPPLQDAILDDATLDRLIRDLTELTQLFEIRGKAMATAKAEARYSSLPEGVAALRAGEIRGLQVFYRHQGVDWLDTLLVTPHGVRIVRIAPPVAHEPEDNA